MRHGWIVLFWIAHVAAHICFKFGSNDMTRWWPSFILGNIFGVAATLILMKSYRGMNANVALALCVGGGFLIVQTAIFIMFKSQLSAVQVVGVLAIAVGMALLSMTRRDVEKSLVGCGEIVEETSVERVRHLLGYNAGVE